MTVPEHVSGATTHEPRCEVCGCDYDGIEAVCGDNPGWDPQSKGYRCMGPKCIAQRAAAQKFLPRKQARELRDLTAPIAAKVRERRQARKTKQASRVARRKGRQ